MANQELVDYIQTQICHGIDIESLKKTLTDNGWKEEEFDEALIEILKIKANQYENHQPDLYSVSKDNQENTPN